MVVRCASGLLGITKTNKETHTADNGTETLHSLADCLQGRLGTHRYYNCNTRLIVWVDVLGPWNLIPEPDPRT